MGGFHRGLAERDFVEGRNVVIEYRWADSPDRMVVMAADFISRKVAVVVTGGSWVGERNGLAIGGAGTAVGPSATHRLTDEFSGGGQ